MTPTTATRRGYDLDELKRRADLVAEVADRAGEDGRRSGRSVSFRCPNPSHPDRSRSFTVDRDRGRWRCWSQCDRSGDVIDLVVWLDNVTARDAIEHLAGRYGLSARTPATGRTTSRPKNPPPPPVRTVSPATDTARPHPDPERAAHLLARFVEGREWSPEVAESVGLSVVLDSKGRPRVRFPFHRGGEVLVWQDRSTGDHEPKWLTPSGATLYPFGLEQLERYPADLDAGPVCPVAGLPAVWLVEGPADAVTLRSVWPTITALGVPGSGGWRMNYAHALRGLSVVVVTDNDPAGEKLREKVNPDLRDAGAFPVNVHVPAEYGDLSDYFLAVGRDRFAHDFYVLANSAPEWSEPWTEEVAQ